ncbi:coilin-like [Rhopilema esculentum]|uniref:coilin-like n=1 Tax=Rhopilema esculentum TaxID=499914 RepID=UPI0031CE2FBA|eukprot:gene4595-20863_t
MESPRVRLHFHNFAPGRGGNSWFLINRSSCKTVQDLLRDIQQSYRIGTVPLRCSLKGYLLPQWENIDIIRDDDELLIEEDPHENDCYQEKRLSQEKNDSRANDILLNKEVGISPKEARRGKKKIKRKRALTETSLLDDEKLASSEQYDVKPKKRKKSKKSHKQNLDNGKQQSTFEIKSNHKTEETEHKEAYIFKEDRKRSKLVVSGNEKNQSVVLNTCTNKTTNENEGKVGIESLCSFERKTIVKDQSSKRKTKKSKNKKEKETSKSLNSLPNLNGWADKLALEKESISIKAQPLPETPSNRSLSFEITQKEIVSSQNLKSTPLDPSHSHIFFHSDDEEEANFKNAQNKNLNKISPIKQLDHADICLPLQTSYPKTKTFNKSEGKIKQSAESHSVVGDRSKENEVMAGPNDELNDEDVDVSTHVQESLEETVEQPKAVRNYESYPELQGPPRAGDNIAFKILEMSLSYTPEISDYKEALVQSLDQNGKLSLLLSEHSRQRKIGDGCWVGKFKLDSDEEDVEDVLEVYWSELIKPKLL